jgi:hypothetical protein
MEGHFPKQDNGLLMNGMPISSILSKKSKCNSKFISADDFAKPTKQACPNVLAHNNSSDSNCKMKYHPFIIFLVSQRDVSKEIGRDE